MGPREVGRRATKRPQRFVSALGGGGAGGGLFCGHTAPNSCRPVPATTNTSTCQPGVFFTTGLSGPGLLAETAAAVASKQAGQCSAYFHMQLDQAC